MSCLQGYYTHQARPASQDDEIGGGRSQLILSKD